MTGVLLTNGRIYTAELETPTVEAMAIRDGRVLAVGKSSDLVHLAGSGWGAVDLQRRVVIPGLIDAHVHLLSFGLGLNRVELGGTASVEEALARIREAVTRARPGEWIQGGGWDKNLWSRPPTRWDLDAVAADNPVLLHSKDMHSQWANSLALKLAGIDGNTEDPAGGEIVRDPAMGEPTGLLREGAGRLVWDAIPPPTEGQCDDALTHALRIAVSRGLTGVHMPEGSQALRALQRLRARGDLILRAYCLIPKDSLSDAARLGAGTGFGDEWLRLGHLKLFLDGALGSQTAHMLEPYEGTGNLGIPVMSREELRELVESAVAAGIAPAIHAIGDAANRVALDVLQETAAAWRQAGLRPRIEHAQLLHPDDAPRLGRLGITASMQPSHQPSDWPVAERFWGRRNLLAYAWRTVLDSGAALAFGSDCPVEPLDPLLGLHAAVTRQTVDGQPAGGWYPEQRLTPLEALRAYTLGPAYASGEESIKGSLAPGKLADFAVLSDDPFAGSPELFLHTSVVATVVGGRVAYGEL